MLYYNIAKDYVNNNILIYFPTFSLMNMYNHTLTPIYNVPVFTYGTIAITTVVLATITVFESGETSKDESILSKLHGLSPTPPPEKPLFGGNSKTYRNRPHKKNKTRTFRKSG